MIILIMQLIPAEAARSRGSLGRSAPLLGASGSRASSLSLSLYLSISLSLSLSLYLSLPVSLSLSLSLFSMFPPLYLPRSNIPGSEIKSELPAE